jgi:hypothetical protein
MLDKITNLFVIAACAVAIWVGIARMREPAPRSAGSDYKVGEELPEDAAGLPPNFLEQRHRTLLMLVSSDCVFCTSSMPFYRDLAKETAGLRQSGRVRLVVLGRESVTALSQYLGRNELSVDAVASVVPRAFKATSTPTLILVDDKRRVTKVWVGRQPAAGEAAIRRALSE